LALDVQEAERTFERVHPDLSVIEFLIQGGAGEQLCRRLKQRSAAPILVLSALDVPDRALQAGADAFLLQPVGHLPLVSAVKDLLGISAVVRRSAEVPQ
jgi:DNA-binding response OmpR family regulator